MRLLYFVCSLAVLYCEGLGGEAVRGLGGGWHGSFTCVVSGNDSGPARHLKRDAHAVSLARVHGPRADDLSCCFLASFFW